MESSDQIDSTSDATIYKTMSIDPLKHDAASDNDMSIHSSQLLDISNGTCQEHVSVDPGNKGQNCFESSGGCNDGNHEVSNSENAVCNGAGSDVCENETKCNLKEAEGNENLQNSVSDEAISEAQPSTDDCTQEDKKDCLENGNTKCDDITENISIVDSNTEHENNIADQVDSTAIDSNEIDGTVEETNQIDDTTTYSNEIDNTTAETNQIDNTVTDTNQIDNTVTDTNQIGNTVTDTNQIGNTVTDTNQIGNTVTDTNQIDNTTADSNQIDHIVTDANEICSTATELIEMQPVENSDVKLTYILTENTADCNTNIEPHYPDSNGQDENDESTLHCLQSSGITSEFNLQENTNFEMSNEIHSTNDLISDESDSVYSSWVSPEDQMMNPNIDSSEVSNVVLPVSGEMMSHTDQEDVHITDLTCPPTVHLVNIIEPSEQEVIQPETLCESVEENVVDSQEECPNTVTENDIAEEEEIRNSEIIYPNTEVESVEAKPSILKVLPIKNGHGIWNIEELRLLLEDRGSIMLKLCLNAEECANLDGESSEADFSAILLEDSFKMSPLETGGILKREVHEFASEGRALNQMNNFIDSYWETETPTGVLNKPHSEPSTFREHLPYPVNSLSLSPRAGRKRGRPPLFSRSYVSKPLLSPPSSHFDEQAMFRTPDSTVLANALNNSDSFKQNNIAEKHKKSLNPLKRHLIMARKAAKIIEQQELKQKLLKTEKHLNELEKEEIVEKKQTVKFPNTGGFSKIFIKLPCPHCPLTFRKRLSLVAHVKNKHKMTKICPICKETVKIIRKNSLKSHIFRVHKDEYRFECDLCDDTFKLPQHLRYHRNFTHKVDDNEKSGGDESDSEESVKPRTLRSKRKNETEEKSQKKIKVSDEKSKDSEESSEEESESDEEEVPRRRTRSSNPDDDIKPQSKPEQKKVQKTVPAKDKDRKVVNQANKPLAKNSSNKKSTVLKDTSESESQNESDESEESDKEETKYFCNICSVGFTHAYKLRYHKNKVHAPRAKPVNNKSNSKFKCERCNQEFPNKTLLERHEENHKPAAVDRGTRRTRSSLSGGLDVLKGKSKLTLEESFKAVSEASKKAQLSAKKDESSESEEEEEDNDSDKEEENESNEEDGNDSGTASKKSNSWPPYVVKKGRFFHCGKCKLTFKREKQMTYHLKKIHETLYPFRKCPDCPRIFRSRGPFVRHLREHKAKQCPINGCKAKYKILRMIKKHQRNSHPDYPHRCQKCVQLFKKSNDLDKHTEKEHSKEKAVKDQDEEGEEAESDEQEEIEEPKPTPKTPEKRVSPKVTAKTDEGRRKRSNIHISYKEDNGSAEEDSRDLIPFWTSNSQAVGNVHVPKVPTIVRPMTPPAIAPPDLRPQTPEIEPAKDFSGVLRDIHTTTHPPHQPQHFYDPLPPKFVNTAPDASRPKRRYVRKAPYKRKVDNSWTAALKARCYGLSPEEVKKEFSVYRLPPGQKSPLSPPLDVASSPATTADVVRRVAESLLTKQQKPPRQSSKRQLKNVHRLRIPNAAIDTSKISFSPETSQLPRVSYSSIVASSRDTSVSSFEDAFAEPPRQFPLPPAIPYDDEEDEDSKELRFDSF